MFALTAGWIIGNPTVGDLPPHAECVVISVALGHSCPFHFVECYDFYRFEPPQPGDYGAIGPTQLSVALLAVQFMQLKSWHIVI